MNKIVIGATTLIFLIAAVAGGYFLMKSEQTGDKKPSKQTDSPGNITGTENSGSTVTQDKKRPGEENSPPPPPSS